MEEKEPDRKDEGTSQPTKGRSVRGSAIGEGLKLSAQEHEKRGPGGQTTHQVGKLHQVDKLPTTAALLSALRLIKSHELAS
jgi:hypothetical protein